MRIVPTIGVIFCLALAGCGADQPIDSGTKDAGKPRLSSKETKAARKIDDIDAVLQPLGKKGRAHVRYDRIRDVQGKQQRQVFVEMLGASVEETDRQMATAFQGRGYTVTKGRADAQGVRLQYRKGPARINALIRSKEASPKLASPEATASLYFRQNLN